MVAVSSLKWEIHFGEVIVSGSTWLTMFTPVNALAPMRLVSGGLQRYGVKLWSVEAERRCL